MTSFAHKIGRGAAVVGLAAAALLAGASSAAAAVEVSAVPLSTLPAGGASGTLDNQVGFTVDKGEWTAQGYAIYPPASPQTYTFDRPVTVRFGVAGLNLAGECVVVPVGTVVETIHANHTWDAVTRSVCRAPGAGGSTTSYFTIPSLITTLPVILEGGGAGAGRGIIELEVGYDLPTLTVFGPTDGSVLAVDDEEPASFACAGGTGTVSSLVADVDGTPIGEGDPVDTSTPGTYTLTVSCTDSYGAVVTESVTFTVADSADVPLLAPIAAGGALAAAGLGLLARRRRNA